MTTRSVERPHVRSLLFVPGNKLAWVSSAVAAGADGIVLDLEDAVPAARRAAARAEVGAYLRDCGAPAAKLFVRTSGPADIAMLRDLEAVVGERLTGVLVPKIDSVADVICADRILAWLERERGLARDSIALVPLLETAQAIQAAFEIASSCARVAYMGGVGVKGGDIERSLGYRWSPEGAETFTLRSSALLAVRAAGVPNPLSGLWSNVDDPDGLRRFAEENRALGYEGMFAIHPSHVPILNEVFSPLEAELRADAELIAAMGEAVAGGHGTTTFDGHMVDEAMVAAARARLARFDPAEAHGT